VAHKVTEHLEKKSNMTFDKFFMLAHRLRKYPAKHERKDFMD